MDNARARLRDSLLLRDSISQSNDSEKNIFPSWMNDEETDSCMSCSKKFSLMHRKHHCEAVDIFVHV